MSSNNTNVLPSSFGGQNSNTGLLGQNQGDDRLLAKIKVMTGSLFSGGSRGGPISFSSLVYRDCSHSLACGPFLPPSASQQHWTELFSDGHVSRPLFCPRCPC